MQDIILPTCAFLVWLIDCLSHTCTVWSHLSRLVVHHWSQKRPPETWNSGFWNNKTCSLPEQAVTTKAPLGSAVNAVLILEAPLGGSVNAIGCFGGFRLPLRDNLGFSTEADVISMRATQPFLAQQENQEVACVVSFQKSNCCVGSSMMFVTACLRHLANSAKWYVKLLEYTTSSMSLKWSHPYLPQCIVAHLYLCANSCDNSPFCKHFNFDSKYAQDSECS